MAWWLPLPYYSHIILHSKTEMSQPQWKYEGFKVVPSFLYKKNVLVIIQKPIFYLNMRNYVLFFDQKKKGFGVYLFCVLIRALPSCEKITIPF